MVGAPSLPVRPDDNLRRAIGFMLANLSAMAFAPSNPQRAYAVNNAGQVFVSNDHGVTWILSSPAVPSQHYFYGNAIAVHPLDADEVVIGGSGYSNPGVIRSTDGGLSWVSANGGLQTQQFYNGATSDPTDPQLAMGGLQDNASVIYRGDGDWALVEVQDDGCGMDSDFVAERLFKPFDTTKGNAGMGVGVYESREFVHALGGEIAVESAPRHGTLFRVKLPVMVAPAGAEKDSEPREAAG